MDIKEHYKNILTNGTFKEQFEVGQSAAHTTNFYTFGQFCLAKKEVYDAK